MSPPVVRFAKRCTILPLAPLLIAAMIIFIVCMLTGLVWVITGRGADEVIDRIDEVQERYVGWMKR